MDFDHACGPERQFGRFWRLGERAWRNLMHGRNIDAAARLEDADDGGRSLRCSRLLFGV